MSIKYLLYTYLNINLFNRWHVKFVNYYRTLLLDLHSVIQDITLSWFPSDLTGCSFSDVFADSKPLLSKSQGSLFLDPLLYKLIPMVVSPPRLRVLNAIYRLETPKLAFPIQTSLLYSRSIYLVAFLNISTWMSKRNSKLSTSKIKLLMVPLHMLLP